MINRNDRRRPSCRMTMNPSYPTTNTSGCQALLSRLQSLDFSIVDTVLYLDVYPDCREALAHYHKLLSERESLCAELAEKCRMPMTSFANASRESWDWTNAPWPWEPDANGFVPEK